MIYKSAHSEGATVEYKKLWYDRVKNREVIHDGTFIYKVLNWYIVRTSIRKRKIAKVLNWGVA